MEEEALLELKERQQLAEAPLKDGDINGRHARVLARVCSVLAWLMRAQRSFAAYIMCHAIKSGR